MVKRDSSHASGVRFPCITVFPGVALAMLA